MNEIERILLSNIPDLKENGEELVGCCPFHKDTKPSFNLNTRTGRWYCFGCVKGGTLLTLLEELTGDLIKSSILVKNIEFEEPEPVVQVKVVLPPDNGLSNYLEKRRFNSTVLRRFGVYYNVSRGLIVPIHDEKNNLVGWVERKHGYKYSRGLPRKRTIYNLNRNLLEDHVFVVEGTLDAIWIEQCGFKAVATLGACVSTEQIDLLNRWFKSITVIPDNDPAGIEMGKRLAKLSSANIIIPPIEGTDIQDYSEEEVRALCQGAGII